jgi:hypothetical protein
MEAQFFQDIKQDLLNKILQEGDNEISEDKHKTSK